MYELKNEPQKVIECTVIYNNDMGHYMPSLECPKSFTLDPALKAKIMKIANDETDKHVETVYEKIPNTPYQARFYKPSQPSKKVTFKNDFGTVVNMTIHWL